jgi:hypothetical protein
MSHSLILIIAFFVSLAVSFVGFKKGSSGGLALGGICLLAVGGFFLVSTFGSRFTGGTSASKSKTESESPVAKLDTDEKPIPTTTTTSSPPVSPVTLAQPDASGVIQGDGYTLTPIDPNYDTAKALDGLRPKPTTAQPILPAALPEDVLSQALKQDQVVQFDLYCLYDGDLLKPYQVRITSIVPSQTVQGQGMIWFNEPSLVSDPKAKGINGMGWSMLGWGDANGKNPKAALTVVNDKCANAK